MEKKDSQIDRYLYAVIDGTAERNFGPIGINGKDVYCISNGHVSAVVSDAPNERIRPERRHLKAHKEVLTRLLEETSPLPMAFGIIGDGSKAIKTILTNNQKILQNQLQRVSGKLEMGLRVTWDVENIFDFFVSTHHELRTMRDRYFGTLREPSAEDKIELGRMFDRVLNEDRELLAEQVEEVLGEYCFEITRNSCRDERVVMNLACLVGRDAGAEFEKGVFKAATLFDNNYAFDYNGPWAPHNFVDIDLKR